MIRNWLRKLPVLVGPTVAVGLLVAFGLARFLPTVDGRLWTYVSVSLLTAALLAIELILGAEAWKLSGLRICLPPLLMTVSAAAWLVLVNSTLGSLAVIAVAALLAGLYQSHVLARPPSAESADGHVQPAETAWTPPAQLAGQAYQATAGSGPEPQPVAPLSSSSVPDELPLPASRPGLAQAGFVTDLFAAFFLTAFLFGLQGFYSVPLPAATAAVGLLWAILAHENLWRFGAERSDRRILTLAFGLIGAETYLGLDFLPVGPLVDTAVSVVILAFGLDLAKQVLFNTVDAKRFRVEASFCLALVAILFVTAKWT